MDLFEETQKDIKEQPLAVRMCPRTLDEFVGQQHILAEGKLLRRAIEADRISSLILYGPSGCGKNAISRVIANMTESYFVWLNAVTSNVDELRKTIETAKKRREVNNKKTIVFLDEIHRFNKAQQDILLPDVEQNNFTLIGATTHNPFFEIIYPLLSRSIVVELKPLEEADILTILKNALVDKERGFGNIKINIDKDALNFLAKTSNGDARRALNALEIGVLTTKPINGVINYSLEVAEQSSQKRAIVYDKDEDGHYDTISAFIKSMRGSDPDAALYWLAKMLYAGEDIRFIARRIVICAAEDVGNADPQALVVAVAALNAAEFVGLPEARIPLAQATVYIACAPKSNASYLGIESAMKDVESDATQQVPLHLRDANYRGADRLGHGKGYKYSHDFQEHFVKQEYLPAQKKYYIPTQIGYEKKIKEWLEHLDSLSNPHPPPERK